MHVHPTDEQLATIADYAATETDREVVMLNLLRFADRANPGFGCDGMTGQEAYEEYGRRIAEMDPPFTGRPIWLGSAGPIVIGPADEAWDQVILVRYDNAQQFLEAVSNPAYLEAAPARDAAIADSRLVAMHELLHDKS
jgi:uncharacterized protein (DUF1330 family)